MLGIGALETCWLNVTGSPLPEAVRQHVGSWKAGGDDEGSDDG